MGIFSRRQVRNIAQEALSSLPEGEDRRDLAAAEKARLAAGNSLAGQLQSLNTVIGIVNDMAVLGQFNPRVMEYAWAAGDVLSKHKPKRDDPALYIRSIDAKEHAQRLGTLGQAIENIESQGEQTDQTVGKGLGRMRRLGTRLQEVWQGAGDRFGVNTFSIDQALNATQSASPLTAVAAADEAAHIATDTLRDIRENLTLTQPDQEYLNGRRRLLRPRRGMAENSSSAAAALSQEVQSARARGTEGVVAEVAVLDNITTLVTPDDAGREASLASRWYNLHTGRRLNAVDPEKQQTEARASLNAQNRHLDNIDTRYQEWLEGAGDRTRVFTIPTEYTDRLARATLPELKGIARQLGKEAETQFRLRETANRALIKNPDDRMAAFQRTTSWDILGTVSARWPLVQEQIAARQQERQAERAGRREQSTVEGVPVAAAVEEARPVPQHVAETRPAGAAQAEVPAATIQPNRQPVETKRKPAHAKPSRLQRALWYLRESPEEEQQRLAAGRTPNRAELDRDAGYLVGPEGRLAEQPVDISPFEAAVTPEVRAAAARTAALVTDLRHGTAEARAQLAAEETGLNGGIMGDFRRRERYGENIVPTAATAEVRHDVPPEISHERHPIDLNITADLQTARASAAAAAVEVPSNIPITGNLPADVATTLNAMAASAEPGSARANALNNLAAAVAALPGDNSSRAVTSPEPVAAEVTANTPQAGPEFARAAWGDRAQYEADRAQAGIRADRYTALQEGVRQARARLGNNDVGALTTDDPSALPVSSYFQTAATSVAALPDGNSSNAVTSPEPTVTGTAPAVPTENENARAALAADVSSATAAITAATGFAGIMDAVNESYKASRRAAGIPDSPESPSAAPVAEPVATTNASVQAGESVDAVPAPPPVPGHSPSPVPNAIQSEPTPHETIATVLSALPAETRQNAEEAVVQARAALSGKQGRYTAFELINQAVSQDANYHQVAQLVSAAIAIETASANETISTVLSALPTETRQAAEQAISQARDALVSDQGRHTAFELISDAVSHDTDHRQVAQLVNAVITLGATSDDGAAMPKSGATPQRPHIGQPSARR